MRTRPEPSDELAQAYDRQVLRHLDALRRRQQWLIGRAPSGRSSYDNGELSALSWVLDELMPRVATGHLVKKE